MRSPSPTRIQRSSLLDRAGGFIQITQSILTQDRDSGCNSHNRCGFDQNNCDLHNIHFVYRCFSLFGSFALPAGIRTRRWTGILGWMGHGRLAVLSTGAVLWPPMPHGVCTRLTGQHED